MTYIVIIMTSVMRLYRNGLWKFTYFICVYQNRSWNLWEINALNTNPVTFYGEQTKGSIYCTSSNSCMA